MTKFLLLSIAYIISGYTQAQAETITSTSTSCSVTNVDQSVTSVTTNSGCSLQATGSGQELHHGAADITVSGSTGMAGNTVNISADSFFSVFSTYARACPNGDYCGPATANLSEILTVIVDTAGPIRNGLVKASALCESGDFDSGGGAARATINGSSICSNVFNVPITLGAENTIELQLLGQIRSGGTSNEGGPVTGEIDAAFFEADGVTPVELLNTTVPEPSATALVALGIAGVWVGRRRRA